jgi:hypothetical protein
MSRSKAIWHQVTACNYQSSKSYGNLNTSDETIYVGSSASNSYEHCQIVTTKREITHKKHGDCIVFKTSVDDVILKETLFKNNKGRAGEYIGQRTKLNSVKSLK